MTDAHAFAMWVLWILLCIGCLALIPAGFYILNCHKPIPSKKTNQMAPTIQMQRLAANLEGEDRTWFMEQARTAGFDVWEPQTRLTKVPVRKETLGLIGGTATPVLITVGNKQYQKFCTTNGFFYLEEVTRAPEVPEHEESTTVRDFTGHILTRCTCSGCSGSSSVPDTIRNGGLPARLDTGQ